MIQDTLNISSKGLSVKFVAEKFDENNSSLCQVKVKDLLVQQDLQETPNFSGYSSQVLGEEDHVCKLEKSSYKFKHAYGRWYE